MDEPRPISGGEPADGRTGVRHLVVTIHGIQTYGDWQARLEALVAARLKDAPPAAQPVFCHYRYGFFSLLAFYFAPTRWLQIRRFRRDLERLVDRYPELERIDIFGHSFGTYLATWALAAKPGARTLPRIANLVLAGSVLRRTHPWRDWIGRHASRVVNECGDRDHILLLNQLIVPFAGAGGLLGFQTFETREFVQRFFQIGHSGYFEPRGGDANWFLNRYWVPIVCEPAGAVLEPARELRPLTAFHGIRLFLLNSSTVLKVALAGAIVTAAFTYILSLYHATEEQRRLAVARLAASDSARLSRTVNDPVHDLPAAALLAAEALRRLPEAEAAKFLLQNALRLAPTIAALRQIEIMALSDDGNRMAVAWGNTIIAIPAGPAPAAQHIPLNLPAGDKITRLQFAADDQFLVALSDRGFAVFRLADKRSILSHRGSIRAIANSPSGKALAIAGADGKVSTAALDSDAPAQNNTPISGAVDLAYASETLLLAAGGKTVQVYDAGTGKVTSHADLARSARSVRLGPDRQQVIVLMEPEAPSARGSDLAAFRLNNGRLEPANTPRSVVTAFDVGRSGHTVFGDESGIVDILRAEDDTSGNNCFLHELQEDVRVNGRSIEDPQPPVPILAVASPVEDFALIAATSRYPELRLFRFGFKTGRCERLGSLADQARQARFLGDGKYVLVRDEGGALVLLDVRGGTTVAQESKNWASAIEGGRRSNRLYFAQGALVRAISLEPKHALEELCAPLKGRSLSRADWFGRFGTETQRPTCERD